MSESFFQGAHHFNVIGGQFIEINNFNDPPSANTALPPLPPLKLPSASFTGRDEYLQTLKLHFSSSNEGKRKVFLLHGLGGIGKTQICLKFIEDNTDLFSDVFWINSSSESNIELGLKQIAEAYIVTPEEKASTRSILQWISHRSKWLMVYDGADGHYSVVEKHLPPGKGGNILITSRNAELKRITMNKNSMEVLDMENEEGVSLLLQSAMLDEAPEHIIDIARKLVSELGGIPLALDQAGGYMHSCGCSIDDYLELYAEHRDELMSSPQFRGASDYGTSTYGTWDVAIQEIERVAEKGIEREAHAAQSAINLLRIFAFLDHANIPEELFKNAAENYMERNVEEEAENGMPLSVKLLDHKTLFLSEEGIWDKLQFLYGIQFLLSFSLIKCHNHLYTVHLLVNAWNRSRLPKGEVENLYQKARAVLSCSMILDYDVDNHAFCQLLVPHIRSSALLALQMKLGSTYYDDEYERFSLVYDFVGDWNAKEKLLQVIVNERSAKLGYHHLGTLMTKNNLANTYIHQGRWDEAEKLHLEVMNTRRIKLGLDHPDTFVSMDNLATTYRIQGRLDEAEELHLEVMNTRKTKLGLDHPDTLGSMSNLANTYSDQGKWDDAETLHLGVMNMRKTKLGLDHPDTLGSMNNLANTCSNQGKWDEAEKLHLEVMSTRKMKLGLDHPDTLMSMNNLAGIYRIQGRWDESERLHLEVMNTMKTKLGLDHPDTLGSMNNLANTYGQQGRWDEAEKLHLEVINMKKTKLGIDHPDTLGSMSNLANTYKIQGRLDEAEQLHLEVMNTRKTKLGVDHPYTLGSMNNLANTYRIQGRLDEAEKLHLEVMSARETILGPNHPDTIGSMHNLANTYSEQGKWDEAEKLHLEVLEKRKTKHGLYHPDTISTMVQLAFTYSNQGKWDEAQALLSHAINNMQQDLGDQHPSTLYVMEVLDNLSEARDKMNSQESVPLPEPSQSNHQLETTPLAPQHNFRKKLKKIWRSFPHFA